MKIVCIGDIHGSPKWKQVVEQESDADLFVFVGDYCDSTYYHFTYQIQNLKEIIQFKKNNQDKVILLLGNHDYWPNGWHNQAVSGYQPLVAFDFELVFSEDKSLFKICHIENNLLFSHAGVSIEFLDRLEYDKSMPIDEYLNEYLVYRPSVFAFGALTKDSEYTDTYGDNIFQSPIWIREKSLMKANKKSSLKKDYIQIFGHTANDNIDIKGKSTGGKYFNVDTLNLGNTYLIIENNIFRIGKIIPVEE